MWRLHAGSTKREQTVEGVTLAVRYPSFHPPGSAATRESAVGEERICVLIDRGQSDVVLLFIMLLAVSASFLSDDHEY